LKTKIKKNDKIIISVCLGTERVYMEVQGQKEIKMFCKDYVERAEV
jgi:hypothetical protein